MKQLTKKQKIFVLKEMIRFWNNAKFVPEWGMCYLLSNILDKDLNIEICYFMIPIIFPEMKPPLGMDIGDSWFEKSIKGNKLRADYCKGKLKLIESK